MNEFIKRQMPNLMELSSGRKEKQKKRSLWVTVAIFCILFTITVFADSDNNNRYEGYINPISAEETATLEQVEAVAELFKTAYIRDDMTLFEKEMAIIEYLLVHVDYDYDAYEKESISGSYGSSHWAYGALIEGKAACDGYTKAFTELANVCGIETKVISGVAVGANAISYNGLTMAQGHTWNLVKLDDGEWYHVDVTFADTSSSYGKYNYDKNQLRASGEYSRYIEGLGPIWLGYINYSDSLLELDPEFRQWDKDSNTANGYLYGPKMVNGYFMDGVIDLSLASLENQLDLTIKQENNNAHNQRTEEILADFAYIIPFTTWDETMSAAESYLSSAPKDNVRLAIKYENQEAYTNAKQGNYSFTTILRDHAVQYGFPKFIKIGDWHLLDTHLDYIPADGQQPVYDIIYSALAGTSGPAYYYNE